MKHLKQEMKQITKDTGQFIKHKKSERMEKVMNKAMEEGFMIKDAIGATDESVETIYSQAYLLYNTGKYREASEIFRLLIMLNSTEIKYYIGLGACFHMLKEYDNAASTYALCSIVDPETPIPHFHASDCYLQMGDKNSAFIALKMAISRAENKPEYSMLRERAQITLEGLKKEIAQPNINQPKK